MSSNSSFPDVPAGLHDVAEIANALVGVIGAMAGNAASPVHAARSAVILDVLNCTSFLNSSLPFFPHSPIEFELNGGVARYAAGACLMNCVIVVVLLIVQLVAARIHWHTVGRSNPIGQSMAEVKFPSLLLILILPMMEPTASSAMATMRFVEGPAQGIVAVTTLLLIVGVLVYAFYITVARFRCVFARPNTEEAEKSKEKNPAMHNVVIGTVWWFITGDGWWVEMPPKKEDEDDEGLGFLGRHSLLFSVYTEKRQWFIALEVLLTGLLGVAHGTSPETNTGCMALLFLLMVCHFAYLAALAALRPFVSPLNAVVGLAATATQGTSALLGAMAMLDDGSDGSGSGSSSDSKGETALHLARWFCVASTGCVVVGAMCSVAVWLRGLMEEDDGGRQGGSSDGSGRQQQRGIATPLLNVVPAHHSSSSSSGRPSDDNELQQVDTDDELEVIDVRPPPERRISKRKMILLDDTSSEEEPDGGV